MKSAFEELDSRTTALGELSLRRRWVHSLASEVYEIKLGEEYLMSSYFTESEEALGQLGVSECLRSTMATAVDDTPPFATGSRKEPTGPLLDIVVGGLGLGYTAAAVLESTMVNSLLVVEKLPAVIDWHRSGLLPLGARLTRDSRCRFTEGDFFQRATSREGFDPDNPGRRYHAILVDIDHSPRDHLDAENDSFYRTDGLRRFTEHLLPGGIFGLWSNDPPDRAFVSRLEEVFTAVRSEEISFNNPLQDRMSVQTVYLARTGS